MRDFELFLAEDFFALFRELVLFREDVLFFREEDFFAALLRELVDLRVLDFFAEDFFALLFFALDFFALDFLLDDFFVAMRELSSHRTQMVSPFETVV